MRFELKPTFSSTAGKAVSISIDDVEVAQTSSVLFTCSAKVVRQCIDFTLAQIEQALQQLNETIKV
ncbi:hypothetical protein O9992_18145 [Vibrio lentus]|nr:hypothetical protein [Vibrio lentus]